MSSLETQKNLSSVKLDYINKYLHGNTILDVGAGTCLYSSWLVQKDHRFSITALDMIDQKPKNINYIQTDLEMKIPVSSESHATILAFDIIEHVTKSTGLLQELYRICSHNGIMIGSVPHDDDKFLPAYNLTFKHRKDLTHKKYYTERKLHEELSSVGFVDIMIFKEGGASPQVIAEFFPKSMQFFIKKVVGILRRIRVVDTTKLSSDLFFIAKKD